MTTKQLSLSLGRHLTVEDPANLTGDAALEVLSAINGGLAWFYQSAPAVLKRSTFSQTFRAPTPVSLTFSEQYSTALTGTPFQADWFGCGLKIAGVNPDNEITGPASVLDQWLSPTLTAQATVLFDCALITAGIERITSDVRLYTSGGLNYTSVLKRDGEGVIDRRRELRIPEPGHPAYYRIEPVGIAAGGVAAALLRIFPAPTYDMTVRFEAEIAPATITFADIVQGAPVPIASSWDSLLVPLCEARLSYSTLWRDDAKRGMIRDHAAEIIATRIPLLAQDFACPDNMVTTPEGF